MTGLVKRSFSLNGHRTSIALEAEFWAVITELATTEGASVTALIARLDAVRAPSRPLASVLRVHALQAQRTVC